MKKAQSYRLRFGGDDAARTRYLYVANVPLYQLSYIPIGYNQIIATILKNCKYFLALFKHFRKFFRRLCEVANAFKNAGRIPVLEIVARFQREISLVTDLL